MKIKIKYQNNMKKMNMKLKKNIKEKKIKKNLDLANPLKL